MKLRALLLSLALTLLALFTFLNWSAFNAPTTLNLGFADVSAPLGLIMLAFTTLICCLFFVYIVLQQAGVIMEARRYAKELKSQRELADNAEASRFTELRNFLENALRRIETEGEASRQAQGLHADQLDIRLQTRLSEATASLSAHLGEIEDKLDRVLAQAPR